MTTRMRLTIRETISYDTEIDVPIPLAAAYRMGRPSSGEIRELDRIVDEHVARDGAGDRTKARVESRHWESAN